MKFFLFVLSLWPVLTAWGLSMEIGHYLSKRQESANAQ